MTTKSVPTSESPHVTLEINGNLLLKGIDDLEVIARADDPEDISLEGEGDEVRVRGAVQH